jgi:Ca2+-binding EF-hand superfamily protein
MYKMDEVIGKYTIKQLLEIFNKYAGEKGALDEESLQLLIKEKLEQYIQKKQLIALMKKIDTDGSGEIEFDEFIEFMRNLNKENELDEDALKEVFKIFDRDEKGYLTPESVYHIFLALGEKIKLEDIINILKENDIDGDGNLNFEDFKMLMHSGLEELEKKNPNSMILNLDNYLNSPFEYNEKKYQSDDNYLNYLSGLNNI